MAQQYTTEQLAIILAKVKLHRSLLQRKTALENDRSALDLNIEALDQELGLMSVSDEENTVYDAIMNVAINRD